MKHNHHSRHKRLKKKFKRLAAAVAGAVILSSSMLPGLPAAAAHASPHPAAGNNPVTATQQVGEHQTRSPVQLGGFKAPTPSVSRQQSPKINHNPVNLSPPAAANQTAAPQSQPVSAAKKAPATSAAEKQAPETKADQAKQDTQQAKHKDEQSTQKDQQEKAPAAEKKQEKSKAPAESSSNAPKDYQDVLSITATAYAPGAHDNDQWGNKTYTGSEIRPGVIAVDPDVIPLGSRVYIQYPDGTGNYAVAEDTGGAIKGNRIDIAMQSVKQAENFGMKNVKVFIVDKAEKT